MTFVLALLLAAQTYTQRGFLETRFTLYPQETANDSGRAVSEELFRYEGFFKPIANLEVAGSLELRTDTHHQVERAWRLSWRDRDARRPLAAVRRLSGAYNWRGLTLEAGKQFVRWGKADIVNPTDRFAPRDFLAVVDNDFLAIAAVRGTYERGANSVDVIWSPRFTPSRVPLRNQRWSTVPAGAVEPETVVSFPRGEEVGLRWNHVGTLEYSISLYQGFNHAPSFGIRPAGLVPDLALDQFYPEIRMLGGDAAIPLRWATVKLEAAYFSSANVRADDYFQYVLQIERQAGEWSFVGGYTGEIVARSGLQLGSFDPDRGLSKTILGRAGYTIDTNRSIAMEAAVRRNGNGAWLKSEFSQAFGQHWRLTTGIGLIAGDAGDFLGQYRRNSHGLVAIRYSF